MAVYLLHCDPPFLNRKHYIGYTTRDPLVRLKEHQSGRGGAYTSKLVAHGTKFTLVHVWPDGTPAFEKWLKAAMATKHWCPTCGINEMPIPTVADMPSTAAARKRRVRPEAGMAPPFPLTPSLRGAM